MPFEPNRKNFLFYGLNKIELFFHILSQPQLYNFRPDNNN